MWRWQRLFDDHIDEVGRFKPKESAARSASAAVTSGLVGLTIGWSVAAVWLAAFLCVEAWGFAATRRLAPGRPGTPIERLHMSLVAIGAVGVWTSVAVIYWFTGSPAFQFVAACALAGILISAPSQSARSLTMLAIITVPPLLALAVLPFFFSSFRGVSLVVIGGCIGLMAMHLAVSVAAHRKAAADLDTSRREAMAANQAKSAFLALMSHEIRTPMTGVLGMAHALAQGPLSDEQRRQVQMLVGSGDGLMTILNDILDLSKIEAGMLCLEESVFDLHEVASGVQQLWSAAAKAKGLDLTCAIEPQVPRWVRGDPTRVRQILLNLVSNAVKFTESGEVRVHLQASGPDRVQITVRDTGIGLTAEQRDSLFKDFSQADASIARRFGGTGLGLSISRRLVGLMDGDITVDSSPGAGTAFEFTLRLPGAAAPELAPDLGQFDFTLAGLRVLVAEDNLINQAVVQVVLSAAEAIVDLAGDGEEALRRMRLSDYDIVLMDIHMPNMDGIEALRRIRAGEVGDPDQPVIALTADAMAGDRERLTALGFDAVESKPIQPAGLLARIAEVCGPSARDLLIADRRAAPAQ